MASARKILIADPDADAVRALATALRRRGHQVHAARDASRALQIAVLRCPDLILLDEAAPLLEADTFARILRTNPRTEHIPVVLTGTRDDPERARLGGYLRKPLELEEAVAHVERLLRRQDASRVVSGEGREIEGNLAQIPLVDLLQILSVNRKTGRLALEREGERAEIALRDGRVVDAGVGTVGGEKALFRLLGRREGQFAFAPGPEAGAERIERRLEELVAEGLRQVDEVAALLPALPQPADTVELAVHPSEIPAGLHPVTERVVELLQRPLAFQELLDRCPSSDLEAMRATAALLEHGYARCREGAGQEPARGDLLAPHELHALRARIARGRSSGGQTVGKVVLAGGGPLARRAARARLAGLHGFAPEAEPPSGGFGTLGRVSLGEGVRVDLVELPGDAAQRPLWRPFASGAVGALVLLPADGMEALLEELSRALRLPVVVCGPSEAAIPDVLREAPGGCAFGGSDAAEGLRALLAGAGARAAGY
jgi:DNA-binding response OmpR family regulator